MRARELPGAHIAFVPMKSIEKGQLPETMDWRVRGGRGAAQEGGGRGWAPREPRPAWLLRVNALFSSKPMICDLLEQTLV